MSTFVRTHDSYYQVGGIVHIAHSSVIVHGPQHPAVQ